jgi:hypothetical protein
VRIESSYAVFWQHGACYGDRRLSRCFVIPHSRYVGHPQQHGSTVRTFTPSPGVEAPSLAPTQTVCAVPPAATVSVSRSPDSEANVTTYVCVAPQGILELKLPHYPGGWTPLQIQPAAAATVTATSTNPDGSANATVHVATSAFTITTATADNLAPTATWTIRVAGTNSP